MVTAELFNTDPVSRNGKDGVTAYYHCSLCDTTTKQTRSQFAIPNQIRCVRCAMNERNT